MVIFENGQHLFRFRCRTTQQLFLAGDFNDWSTTALPMDKVGEETWETRLKLPVGAHHFRYVTQEGQWHTDFSAPNVVANVYGGWDSVVFVSNRRVPRENDLIEVKVETTSPQLPIRASRSSGLHRSRRRSRSRRARVGILPPLTLLPA